MQRSKFEIRKVNIVNHLYLIFIKVNGYFNKNKYWTLVPANESKENI